MKSKGVTTQMTALDNGGVHVVAEQSPYFFLQFLCLIWSEKHGNERVNPESSQSMFLDRCDWENIFGLYVTKTKSKIKCKHDIKVLSYRCIEIV